MSDSTPSTVPPSSQFLTVAYNPAVHPRQISLLDASGQPILYALVPANQATPTHITAPSQANHLAMRPSMMNTPPSANACSVCGSDAFAKCSYGISRGTPCGRLLCLAHVMELPGANGGRYPHCPEHFQHIQQKKCHVM
jgi:hypothetical protein